MDNLKSYRENEIKWYVLAYLLLVVVVCYPTTTQSVNIELATKIETLITSTFLSGIVCSLAFVFDSLFSSQLKDILLYLGFTKMPGATVFTRIQENRLRDLRINIDGAQSRYKEIIESMPSSKEKQRYENSKWYSLYSAHKEDVRVLSVHRDFLLCRDLYTTTVSLTVLTLIMMAISLLPFSWIILGYLLIMLVVTNIAAHNKASRFVNTVIAVDLASAPKLEN
ncbi:hypothetical protein FRZ06_02895 [Anoxybacterium hadale]|uniref:Uncharacterized protein n=1 Tax=Anoxybacterium hadale TaxID=3408580 RepID=A0ACD1A7P3_9FIRM|nr:hypothetical protein FRZ06_02895 [Clostridiales bacterium]